MAVDIAKSYIFAMCDFNDSSVIAFVISLFTCVSTFSAFNLLSFQNLSFTIT